MHANPAAAHTSRHRSLTDATRHLLLLTALALASCTVQKPIPVPQDAALGNYLNNANLLIGADLYWVRYHLPPATWEWSIRCTPNESATRT